MTKLRLAAGHHQTDTFAFAVEISSVEDTNNNGDSFLNFGCKLDGWATKEQFEICEKIYEAYRDKTVSVKMDADDESGSEVEAEVEEGEVDY